MVVKADWAPTDIAAVRRPSLWLLGLGSLAFPAVFHYPVYRPPASSGDAFFPAPSAAGVIVAAIGVLGAICGVVFLMRALLGIVRREPWSGAILGLAIVPFVPFLMSQLVDWGDDRVRAGGAQAVRSTAELFVAHVDAGNVDAACSLSAPTLAAQHPSVPDCRSLLASYAYWFPGELAIRDLAIRERRLLTRGDAVVVEQGRPVFELGLMYDPDTKQARATSIETLARS
jgi:hypothetical protein